MKKFDTVKLIGLIGVAVGALASTIGNYAQSKEMERMIDEKINEALAEREEKDEEES